MHTRTSHQWCHHSIEVTGDEMARATVPEAPKRPIFYFMIEGGAWKFSLWKTFPDANTAIQQMIRETKLSDDQYFIRTLGAISANEIDEEVYNELLSGPREAK